MCCSSLRDKAPVRFELGAATVDPCIEGFDPSFLKDYVSALDVPYFYRRQDIVGRGAQNHARRFLLRLLFTHAPRHIVCDGT